MKEIEVRGSNMRVYANAQPSMPEVWLASAAHANNDCLIFGDERWTYAQAHRDVASIANWLASQGLEQGNRVAIAMRKRKFIPHAAAGRNHC